MILQPIDYVVYAWLAIAVLSAAYVAFDQFRHNPEAIVMKWGFVLVTLYTGPFGMLLYVFADKEPAPDTHEAFVAPLWKQAVGSTVHCVALNRNKSGVMAEAVASEHFAACFTSPPPHPRQKSLPFVSAWSVCVRIKDVCASPSGS